MKLGKKKEIDIRTLWKHEANDFTKWLAQEENLYLLSESLDLNLSLIERERSVGDFKCDIFCEDEDLEKNVIIENQLTQTNHDHLGKIITYASGLKASIVIWIVQNARAEHISAISWLNEKTDEDILFFLVELHAYTIDDSLPTIDFKIIEKPKEFNKKIKISNSLTKSELNIRQSEFWKKLNEYLGSKKRVEVLV
ncbi:MAG: hypothetical protein OHM56_03015 [Spiroplasma phoeniceum]|nr:MAG: hypothetical protein OHM57_02465 [Spiroplasma phoeniceum]UZQ32936.1 MAG: hypothetical protein OHM56_03015 [Spiroplasma phoeniceum]